VAKLVGLRILSLVPLLLMVSVAVFSLTYLMPGSTAAAVLGVNADPEAIEALEAKLGLDRSPVAQFQEWFGNVLHGDLGTSLFSGQEVGTLITTRLSATFSLTFGAMAIAIVLGVLGGVLSALRAGTLLDRGISVTASAGLSVPDFWVGIVLLNVFSVGMGWFPVISWTPPSRDPVAWLQGLVLPCLALGITGAAVIARQMRGAMLETLEAPYVQTLRAIGTSWRVIVFRYALKNAFIPVLTVVSFLAVATMGGTFVIEEVFTIPGIGSLMLDAVARKDMPVVQGITLLVAVWVALVYLLVDICYGLLNPRIRPA